jgi:hypothetical protein
MILQDVYFFVFEISGRNFKRTIGYAEDETNIGGNVGTLSLYFGYFSA